MDMNFRVMKDAFSKFSVTVIILSQQAKTVAKAQVDMLFNTYGILSRIHSDQVI